VEYAKPFPKNESSSGSSNRYPHNNTYRSS